MFASTTPANKSLADLGRTDAHVAPGSYERGGSMHEQMEASLPSALAAAWAITTLDVQKTLRHVCDKVLEDGGVSQPTTSMQL